MENPLGDDRAACRVEGRKGGGKQAGAEAAETGPRRGTSGAERDTGYQVDGGKEDKLWEGRWRPAVCKNFQVDSRPEPGRYGYIRVQHIGEAQSNGRVQG